MKRLIFILLLISRFALATPQPHGINFSWTNPTGYTITANTLYCGTASGVYTFNWVFSPSQAFSWTTTDPQHTGTPGTKYYCVVTDTVGGIESSYSNEVSATFPQVPSSPSSLTMTPF